MYWEVYNDTINLSTIQLSSILFSGQVGWIKLNLGRYKVSANKHSLYNRKLF